MNARHVPFGVTVRDLVGARAASLLGCHIMNDESVVFGLSQKTPEQRKAAYWLCGLGVALIWPLGTLLGAGVGKLLPAPETIGWMRYSRPSCWRWWYRLLKRTTLIRACSARLFRWPPCPSRRLDYRFCSHCLAYWRGKIMGNMTLFIAGIAILSIGTYLMRLGGAKLGSRLAFSERSQALLSDAATVLLFSVALATTFMKASIFPAWRGYWASVLPCSLRRKMPLIVVIIAAAVVTALLRGGYKLKAP